MKFKDKEALKQLKIINHYELNESIATFPENERDGRNDLQILFDEASYFLEMYDDDTIFYEALEDAKSFMKETKNGKVIPCWHTFLPVPKYSIIELKNRTNDAKNTINEYKRLKNGVNRLKQLI